MAWTFQGLTAAWLQNTAVADVSEMKPARPRWASEIAARTCPNAARELEMAARACPSATRALEIAAWACPGAVRALGMAARAPGAAQAFEISARAYPGALHIDVSQPVFSVVFYFYCTN